VKVILILEDEPCVMKFQRATLEQRYSVIGATTGEEGLLLFIDHGCRVDLLIADLTLPVLSGLKVALLLRAKLPDLPVILTSGYPVCTWCDRDSADLGRLGSRLVTVLPKPFQALELTDAVCDLIGSDKPGETGDGVTGHRLNKAGVAV
jgi:CheY-like chemotaxis protein